MSIIEKILIKKPRETVGSRTQNLFDYQISFAAYLILKLLDDKKSFLAFLDYLDDIVIMDEIENPTQITFYQVKTSNKSMTLTTMISKKYLEHMNENVSFFVQDNVKAVFVSNEEFLFGVKNARNNKLICYNEENSLIDFTTFINQSEDNAEIMKQIKDSVGDIDLSKFYLYRTSLPIKGHDVYIKGHLVDYLQQINSKLDIPAINSIYLQFIKKLSDLSANVYNPTKIDKEQLVKTKAFDNDSFAQILSRATELMIPIDHNKVFTFSVSVLSYKPVDINIKKFSERYTDFSLSVFENPVIYSKIVTEIKKISVDCVSDESLVSYLIEQCDKNSEISTTTYYKRYIDLIILVLLYKGVDEYAVAN